MRNLSFALTVKQFCNGTKDVTRRLGWANLRPASYLMACEKCQGVSPGELFRLGVVLVVSVRREALKAIDADDVRREGFPQMTPRDFVTMFCRHMGCAPSQKITRIEFQQVDSLSPDAWDHMSKAQRAWAKALTQRPKATSP